MTEKVLYQSVSVTVTGTGSGATASVEGELKTGPTGRILAYRTRLTSGSGTPTYSINQATSEGDAVNNQGVFDPVLTVADMNEPVVLDPPVYFKTAANSLFVSANNDGGGGDACTFLFEVWWQP